MEFFIVIFKIYTISINSSTNCSPRTQFVRKLSKFLDFYCFRTIGSWNLKFINFYCYFHNRDLYYHPPYKFEPQNSKSLKVMNVSSFSIVFSRSPGGGVLPFPLFSFPLSKSLRVLGGTNSKSPVVQVSV